MDGRDIGNVVLKDAELKIFLTASLKLRGPIEDLKKINKKVSTLHMRKFIII